MCFNTGNNGKTEFTKYLYEVKDQQVFICQGGKYTDIMHAYNNEPYVVFDLPRAVEPEKVSYHAMESFKDGMCFSGKYQSAVKLFEPPK